MTTALQLATLGVARQMRKRKDDESQSQRALIEWASMASFPCQIPNIKPDEKIIDFLYAIPNGGARSKATAGKLKAEGVKAGVWDLKLEVPIGKFPGLWIEMKAGKNTLSKEQVQWRDRMQRMGFKCVVCWDWLAAKDHIMEYLGSQPPRPRVLAALDQVEAGELANPKEKRVRSEKYLRLVAAFPCANCGIDGFSQAAHPNTGKGMGLKADDNLCFPLCATRPGEPGCHARFDQGAMYTKSQRRDLEKRWGKQTFDAIRRQGKVPMGMAIPKF